VPTFTCGFVRSNFAFAIELIPIGLRYLVSGRRYPVSAVYGDR